ncbi:MAG: putative signal transduction protein with EAL and GGDEF domain [Gammaproteobacteria bacterium]|jgi:predicted signal transduction protein with EAL and GGDEF domain
MDSTVYCGSSIGISVYLEDGTEIESLLAKAGQAMYEVKRSGKNGWHFFSDSMQIRSEKRHRLYNRFIQAIKSEQLVGYCQPIVNLSDSKIVKCEALVRWFDHGKLVPTADFISLAEETGKINEIDRFVLVASTQYLLQLAKTTSQKLGLSITLSPSVFSTKGDSLQLWLSLVVTASKELDITVEITERLLTKDTNKVLEVINILKSHGISMSIAIGDWRLAISVPVILL